MSAKTPLTEAQRLIAAEQRRALEDSLYVQLRQRQVPEPVREYAFAPGRKYRADFAWPDRRILAEVDGGTWAGGHHVQGSGFEADCRKTNLAVALGWRVLRFTAGMVRDESAAELLAEILGRNEG